MKRTGGVFSQLNPVVLSRLQFSNGEVSFGMILCSRIRCETNHPAVMHFRWLYPENLYDWGSERYSISCLFEGRGLEEAFSDMSVIRR